MLKINKLCKAYNNVAVLENFDLTIKEGGTYCILGKSGIGKTTLLRILMNLETLDSGTIEGLEKIKISTVFQEDRLLEYLDVYSNIVISDIKNIKEKTVEDALKKVGLEECKHQIVSELSGGMKRRVAILRACLAEFDLLLLDEPFKGLDEETKKQVLSFVEESIQDKTMIFITHDSQEIAYFKKEVEVINLG